MPLSPRPCPESCSSSASDTPTSVPISKCSLVIVPQDYCVHIKHLPGSPIENDYEIIPYFSLPSNYLAHGVIGEPCRSCFDYTNGLADIVVGYMGVPYFQVPFRELPACPLLQSPRVPSITSKLCGGTPIVRRGAGFCVGVWTAVNGSCRLRSDEEGCQGGFRAGFDGCRVSSKLAEGFGERLGMDILVTELF